MIAIRAIGSFCLFILAAFIRFLPQAVFADWADMPTRAIISMSLFTGAAILFCLSIKEQK